MRKRYQHRWYVLGLGILILGGILSYTVFFSQETKPQVSKDYEQKEIQTVSPQAYQPQHTVFGTVKQHGYAIVHPRRDGIISDIYTDIGDEVTAGQAIASFFPPGVEGQSSSLIEQKTARVAQARVALETAQALADETLKIARRDVLDKNNAFAEVTNTGTGVVQNQTSQKNLNQVRVAEQALVKAQASLQTAKETLSAAQADSGQQINETTETLTQAQEQAFSVADEARGSLVNIFFEESSTSFNFSDLSNNYGALSSSIKLEFERLLTLSFSEEVASATELLKKRLILVKSAEDMIKNSSSGTSLTQDELNTKQEKIIALRSKLLTAQEKLTKAQQAKNSKESSENETIIKLEQLVIEQEEQVKSAERNLDLAKTALGESVENAKETLKIQETTQNKRVAEAKKALDVALADLQKERIAAGHTQLLAPFSGTIAVRNINLGDRVTPADIAFEMVGTQNSLTRKSPVQIHFTLPESLFGALTDGDEVEVRSVYHSEYFTAKVEQISRQMHDKTQGYMVQATPVENINLAHGSTVKIMFQDQSPRYYQVPATAVKRERSEAFVFVKIDPVIEEETEDVDNTEHGSANKDHENMEMESEKDALPVVEKRLIEVRAVEGEYAQIMGDLSEDTPVVTSFPDQFINLQNND